MCLSSFAPVCLVEDAIKPPVPAFYQGEGKGVFMNCGYKEKTILYFYGELPPGGSAEVMAHLKTCSSCAADLSVLKGLSEGLDVFRPRPPELYIEVPALVSPGIGAGGLFAGFMRRAMVGVIAAAFLAAFHLPDINGSPSGWQGDIDAGLENIESRISTLQDEMGYPVSTDFEYKYSDLETRKEQANERI